LLRKQLGLENYERKDKDSNSKQTQIRDLRLWLIGGTHLKFLEVMVMPHRFGSSAINGCGGWVDSY